MTKQKAAPKDVRRPAENPEPRASNFVAPPCSRCHEDRCKKEGTKEPKNYSRVYAKRGLVRYIRCHFCMHTWSVSEKPVGRTMRERALDHVEKPDQEE